MLNKATQMELLTFEEARDLKMVLKGLGWSGFSKELMGTSQMTVNLMKLQPLPWIFVIVWTMAS